MTVLRGKRPTQADVARRANVSQSVVSYILNGKETVAISPGTRQRVLNAIEALGYIPDGAARSLRTRKTFTIAGLIPDITNPFYPALERGIQDVAEQHGYDVVTYNTDGTEEKERTCLAWGRRGRVDGVIVTPFHLTADDFRPLLDLGVAVVLLGTVAGEIGDAPLDHLYVDNALAAHDAVSYLIDLGHTRIGMVAGEAHTPPRDQRVEGYRRALRGHRIPLDEVLIRAGDFTEAGGYQSMQGLLALKPRPTAVFAANDLMAIGAVVAAREASLRVSDDLSIVGFDDIPAAKLVTPPLTTIAQFPERIGRRAAEMLFERLSGAAPMGARSEVMPHQLMVRGSTRAIAATA